MRARLVNPSALALLTVAVALTACNSNLPPDWPIAGLTLPPGARPALLDESYADGIVPGKVWVVGFEQRAGWNNVVAHIKGCMDNAGYTAETHGMGGAVIEETLFDNAQHWSAADGSYRVILHNLSGEQGRSDGKAPFVLIVLKN